MEGNIQFRFKSERSFTALPLAAPAITLDALKRAISAKIGLRSREIDLLICNAHTGVHYTEPSGLIPNHSSVVVTRVLLAPHQPCNDFVAATQPVESSHHAAKFFKAADGGREEAGRLDWVTAQSRLPDQHHSHTYFHARKPQGRERMCFFCHERGHLIDSCPKRRERERMASERAHQHWLRTHRHGLGTKRKTTTTTTTVTSPGAAATDSGNESGGSGSALDLAALPQHLVCPICHGPQREAVSVPCCSQAFCDACIRSHLLSALAQDATPACFSCHAEIIPDVLAANDHHRAAVAAWTAA